MNLTLPGLRTFTSFAQFAQHLTVREQIIANELRESLHVVTKAIQKTARDELGHYQDAIGPFVEWEELADSTKQDRVSQGFTENDPLLRSGELRDSIQREVVGLDGYVGSEKDEAVYMELGTTKAPPRAFLGPAVYHQEGLIRSELGGALVRGLLDPTLAPSTQVTERVIQ